MTTKFDEWKTYTEQEMRAEDAPRLESAAELAELAELLTTREHDYGTCVYAMSVLAVAAYGLAGRLLGVTGFQAGCADMDILRRTRRMERFRVQDFGGLLYPQYRDKFADWDKLIEENADWLREEAKRLLCETKSAHPDVVSHWRTLAGLEVEEAPRG